MPAQGDSPATPETARSPERARSPEAARSPQTARSPGALKTDPARRAGSRSRIDRRELAAIFVGGCAGALVRTAVSQLGTDHGPWPLGTFAVNVCGCLLLGYFTTRLQERLPVSRLRRPLLGTGFCGALTTFSTLQLQLLGFLDSGRYLTAGAYAASSVAAGLIGVALATALVRRVRTIL